MSDPTNAARQRAWYARQKAGTPWQPLTCQGCGGNSSGTHDPMKLNDLQVDLIGLWIWIRGNTKPQKDALKALGCRWHSGRLCWYWKPEWMGRSRSNPGSLEELARKYGCQGFTSQGQGKLAAA